MAEKIKTIHPFFSEGKVLFPVLLLSGIGIIMVYSASSAISMENHNSAIYYMQKQCLFFGISLCAMFITASLPYNLYKKFSYLIFFFIIALLVAVLVPQLNMKAGGANRWLNLWGFTFQPAELTKLLLILFLGYSLSKKQEMIKLFFIGFFPHALLFSFLAVLIIFQPDFGTIVVLGLITWGMMFIAGVKIIHLLSPTPLLIPVIYFWVYKVEYRMERIMTFLNPWNDPSDAGYQVTHSLKAFGSGGIFGKGLGLGMQKMHYLPEPHTDFIFSIIGEEFGLAGVLTVLSLYLVLLLKGIDIAKTSDTAFGAITASGITIYIGIQVIINTGVALGALPTKGLTLPFISYGGTSLLVNMAAMGILMNIGASQKK
ncbi:putative lipid II flippase FtsW [Desulfobacula toluolica]|uniref:Probable peptidoglycan glycosyltransferase FtsW n=1 Tax=Desulfobacula toluolica (strain DSM 7467 / Tol2) TaxID=651182 RepID=K0N5N8_DESTT|nr:putative lipid II flippase FtsW [Desulfobacula toluolica]CCK79374.1 FtsW: cell division protein FtsW [Desulfobacula toluolica Tol2]